MTYKTEMREEVELTRDMLLLIGYKIPMTHIWEWSARTIEAVQNWCGCVHMRAPDNPIRIPEFPEVLGEYRRG